MGRIIPIAQIQYSNYPILAWSFFIACFAATIALVSSLCGLLSHRKSTTTTTSDTAKSNTNDDPLPEEGAPRFDESVRQQRETISTSPSMARNQEDKIEEDYLNQPLPPPPGMRVASSSSSRHHNRSHSAATSQGKLTSSTSQENLSSSASMRASGSGFLSMRQSSKREDNSNKKHDKKLKHEDSIWKKQIILGEKCRVPEEDDDTILYDEKGNRISTYHPRVSSSLPISRQTSDIDPDAIPS